MSEPFLVTPFFLSGSCDFRNMDEVFKLVKKFRHLRGKATIINLAAPLILWVRTSRPLEIKINNNVEVIYGFR